MDLTLDHILNGIVVYPFDDAPAALRALSDNGGDEDWIAVVPDRYSGRYISWLWSTNFGACDTNKYKLDGFTIYIGVHA